MVHRHLTDRHLNQRVLVEISFEAHCMWVGFRGRGWCLATGGVGFRGFGFGCKGVMGRVWDVALGGLRRYRSPQNLGGNVTKCAPHNALKLIASGQVDLCRKVRSPPCGGVGFRVYRRAESRLSRRVRVAVSNPSVYSRRTNLNLKVAVKPLLEDLYGNRSRYSTEFRTYGRKAVCHAEGECRRVEHTLSYHSTLGSRSFYDLYRE
jgi:hypothetical protein